MVVIAIFVIDTLVCLLQKVEIETRFSVDSDYVYELSNTRILTKANRYLEVLNRDDANAQVDQESAVESLVSGGSEEEESLYETKGSDFNAGEENLNNSRANLKTKGNLDGANMENEIEDEPSTDK